MANERNPDDPYRRNPADDEYRWPPHLDNELQPDPELAEGPASGAKVAMFAVAIAVVLGAIFYGLNNTTINQAGKASLFRDLARRAHKAGPRGARQRTADADAADTEIGSFRHRQARRPDQKIDGLGMHGLYDG